MNAEPLVSVIVPAYNAERYISDCLKSIISQTYQNLEIIVVDDGSTDSTPRILREYDKHIRYFRQKPSGGPATPRNFGISRSNGKYICFCDNDDIMIRDRIAEQVGFMQRQPEATISFCDYRNFDANGPFTESHFQTCSQLWAIVGNSTEFVLPNASRILASENFGICGTLMFRRSLLEQERAFDPTLIGTDDFDFYFRLARQGKVGIINQVGQMRRKHGENLSDNLDLMMTMAIRCRTLLRDSEKDAQTKILLNKYIATNWSGLARRSANSGRYLQSLQLELKALTADISLDRLKKSMKNVVRTTLIAVGVHHQEEV
ncbi:MAG: glycosyltransferase family A protein [Desulfatitalea sp.]